MASRKFSDIRNSYAKIVAAYLDIADYCMYRIRGNSFAAAHSAA